jgi:signal transduction histidine kinase
VPATPLGRRPRAIGRLTVQDVTPWVDLRSLRGPQVAGATALAAIQVGGTIGASHRQPSHRALDAVAIAIAVAGPASLLALARWPRQVMWFVAAITLLYLLRGYAYGPVFASLAIVTVATVVVGHRGTAWAGLATVIGTLLVLQGTLLDEQWPWTWVSGVIAWSLVVLAFGEVIRIRRERISASRLARAESTRRHANEERLQIARELHDVVAHHISLINVQAGVALHIVDRRPEQAQTALEAIKDASKEALVELRSLVGVLRAEADIAPLQPSGTLATLDDMVQRSSHAGLAVRKSETGLVRPLPAAVELAAVRIVQEAVTNVVRHSSAETAEVTLRYEPDRLEIVVEDDGRGLGGSATSGTGLVGMRERAQALGGSLDVSEGTRGGVRVRALLPLRGEP